MAAPSLLLLFRAGATTLLSTTARFLPRRPHPPLLFLPRPTTTTSTSIPFPAFCTTSSSSSSSSSSSAAATPLIDPDSSELAVSAAVDSVKEAAGLLDIRVGRVVKTWRHPDAETLYVEEVDVGEEENRVICSGLVKYVPIEGIQDKLVVVLANLKPRNMRGVKSSGMLMAASDASHENVELLVPPQSSVPGERIWFGLENEQESQPAPATANQIQKKKIWELVQPHLKTDASCTAMLGEHAMRTSGGPVVSKSLKHANIS